MAEEILYSFKTEADFRGFQRESENFTGTLEEFIDLLKKFKATVGDAGKFVVTQEIKSKVSGIVELGKLKGEYSDLEKGERKLIQTTKQKLKADQDSKNSIQQRLNQAKQELALMGRLSAGYAEQEQRVKALTLEYRRASGIQEGSVADIKAETQAIQQRLQNEQLSIQTRKELTNQLQVYSLEALKAQGVEEGSVQYLRAQQAEQQRLVDSLKAGSAEQLRAAAAVQEYQRQIDKATPKTLSFFGALNKIATLQAGLTAIGAAINSVSSQINKVVNRVKQVEGFELAFRNLGLSATDASRYFAEAASTATQLGAPLEQVEKTYKRLVPVLLAAGASSSEASAFITALTARTQTLGLSTEESGRYLEAFAQVISKGKLQGEELNQQISELDGSFRGQFAQSLGYTTQQLNAFVEEGSVGSDKVIKGFLGMSNGVEQLAGNVTTGNQTIQQLQNQLSGINTKTLEAIGAAIEPGIRAFLRAAVAFAGFVQRVAESPIGTLIGTIFNEIGKNVERVVQIFTSVGDVLIELLSPIASILSAFAPLISIFVTYVAVVKTGQLAFVGFAKVLEFTGTAAAGLTGPLGSLVGGFGKVGGAIKSLFTLDLVGFFNNARQAGGLFINSLKVESIEEFTASLTRMRTAFAGGEVLDAGAEAIDEIGDVAQKGKKPVLDLADTADDLGDALDGAGTKGKGASGKIGIFSNIVDLFSGKIKIGELGLNKFGKTAAKTTAVYGGLGEAATTAAGAAARGGAAYGQAAAGVAATGAASALTAGALAILTVKFIAVMAALAAVAGFLRGYYETTGLANDAINKTTGSLRELGVMSKDVKGPIQKLLDTIFTFIIPIKPIVAGLRAIGDVFAFLGTEVGFRVNLEKMAVQLDAVNKQAKKAGLGGLLDFSNAAKLSGKDAQALISSFGALATGAEEYAAALDKKIQKMKEDENANKGRIKQLEEERNKQLNIAADYRYAEGALAALTAQQRLNNAAIQDSTQAVEVSKKAIETRNQQLDQAQTKLTTEAQNEYNKGLITEAELQLRTAAYAAAASEQKKKAVEDELAYISALRAKDGVEREKLRAREKELIEQQSAAAKEAALAQTALLEAQKKKLQEVGQQAEELAGIYQESANVANSSFDNLGSAVTGALNELKSTIASQAALEFRFTGDYSVVDRALALQGRILQVEYQIGRTKAEINKAQRDFELQMIALKTQQIILEAKAGPDTERARAVVAAGERQLQIVGQIGALNDTIYQAEILGLDAKTQRLQTAQNIVRQTLGLPPLQIVEQKSVDRLTNDFENLASQAQAQMAEIGPAIVSSFNEGTAAGKAGFDELDDVAAKIQKSLEQFNKQLEQGVKAITEQAKELATKNYGVKLGEELAKAFGGSLDKFASNLKEAPKEVDKVKGATDKLKSTWDTAGTSVDNFNKKITNTNTLLKNTKDLVGTLPNLSNARAMGGPVAAGASYLVNDGGGREGFVDKFNNFKLLPAGRNIQWRAPSDGYVVPAAMTESIIQNSKINAKISTAGSNKPSPNANTSVSGVSNSGNLIKQMSAAMGGSTTQRITNHVTIQSQSPVSDASRIMANVARLRARRGIGL